MANEEPKSPDLEMTDSASAAADAELQTEQSESLSETEQLKSEIEALQQQLAEAKDQSLRAVADSQNAIRRAEKEVENARKFALERFATELLPVVDNLERALDVADNSNELVKAITDGVALTHKSFIDVLSKFQLVQVNPVGEPFDPQLHQAMTMVENPDVEPNTVISVMQKGFTLNGRLVRPAMVVVSKASSAGIDTQA